jgi:hypothetical protein
VGQELYARLLSEALVRVRGTAIEPTPVTDIDLGPEQSSIGRSVGRSVSGSQ